MRKTESRGRGKSETQKAEAGEIAKGRTKHRKQRPGKQDGAEDGSRSAAPLRVSHWKEEFGVPGPKILSRTDTALIR